MKLNVRFENARFDVSVHELKWKWNCTYVKDCIVIDVHALFWFCSHNNVSLWTNVPLDKQNNRIIWMNRILLAFFPHTERVSFWTLLRAPFAVLPTLQHSKKYSKNELFSFIFHVKCTIYMHVSDSSWTNQPEYSLSVVSRHFWEGIWLLWMSGIQRRSSTYDKSWRIPRVPCKIFIKILLHQGALVSEWRIRTSQWASRWCVCVNKLLLPLPTRTSYPYATIIRHENTVINHVVCILCGIQIEQRINVIRQRGNGYYGYNPHK